MLLADRGLDSVLRSYSWSVCVCLCVGMSLIKHVLSVYCWLSSAVEILVVHKYSLADTEVECVSLCQCEWCDGCVLIVPLSCSDPG